MMSTAENHVVFNEIIVYAFAGMFAISTTLIGWLCVKTVDLGEKSTAILEHNISTDKRLDYFQQSLVQSGADQRTTAKQIDDIKLAMAEHGWRER
jgi:hypothetical protein